MDIFIKSKIIDLVQKSKDDLLLEQIFSILDNGINYKEGTLFKSLSIEEREETYLSSYEAQNPDNLVDHETAMDEIRKKLGWS